MSVSVEGARSADPPTSHGSRLAIWFEHLARTGPRGQPLGVGGKRFDLRVPAVGQFAPPDEIELLGLLGELPGILGITSFPGLAEALAAGADVRLEVGQHLFGHEELLVFRPAVGPLGEADLLLAQRRAVGPVRVLLVGARPGDHAADDDQRRPVGRLLETCQGGAEGGQVVDVVDLQHVPAVAGEALRDVSR